MNVNEWSWYSRFLVASFWGSCHTSCSPSFADWNPVVSGRFDSNRGAPVEHHMPHFPSLMGWRANLLRDLMIQPNYSASPFLSSFGSQKIEDFKCQLVWDLDFGPASLNGLWTWPLSALSALSALQLCFSHRGSELGTAVISMTTAVVVKVLNLPDPKSKSKRWGLQPITRFTVDSWLHETMHRSPPGDLRGFSFCLKQKPWQCQNFSAELNWKFDYSPHLCVGFLFLILYPGLLLLLLPPPP